MQPSKVYVLKCMVLKENVTQNSESKDPCM